MTMRMHVFIGPSAATRLSPVGVQFHDPVCAGDLTDLARSEPGTTALIIDGYFGQRLALTVREIRRAQQAGLHVYGGVSMGAIRAAEAGPVGMIGVGQIYRDILSGRIVDDAELSVAAVAGGPALTVPFVNVRRLATIALERHPDQRGRLTCFVERARDIYFASRTIDSLSGIAEVELGDGPASDTVLALLAPSQQSSWDLKGQDVEAAILETRMCHQARHAGLPMPPIPANPDRLLNERGIPWEL